MKTQTVLRICVLLVWLSFITDVALTVLLHNSLPAQLRDWHAIESSGWINAFGAVVLVSWVVASVGLLRLRRWAAWAYLCSVISAYALMPFYGPVVSHGVTGAINGVFGVLSGVTLALAFVPDHLTSLASNRYSDSPSKRSSTISETTTNRMTLFFDPNDPNLRAKIEALVPTPGYCVLVDMVGSTAMKDAPILQWAPKIHNAFANTMAFLDPSIRPLKSIGDELMFYIPCEKLAERGEGPLCLYSGLFSVAGEKDPLFTDVKIAIAYCERAYRLSFLPGVEDIYGKDIDLTARLLSKAPPCEIVMNEAFVHMLKRDFETNARGNQDQFPEVNRITGPVGEPFKGFAAPVPVFRVKAG